MKCSQVINFGIGYLKQLEINDVSKEYIDGLNDPSINRFLDSVKQSIQTETSVISFIQQNIDSNNSVLLGIFESNTKHLCGTVRIHGIDSYHRVAHIGICIFNKQSWGRGLGKQAVKAATTWAQDKFDLRWLEAGVYEQNIASQKVFLSCGYDWVFDVRNKYLLDDSEATIRVFAKKQNVNKSSDLGE